jgi:4-methyl-5(b-hydroxyethyl)-thiazole monophosphate biosynthesis
VTCYPGVQENKFDTNYVNQDVVVSKNFITASGPGTASRFAFKVIEYFENASKAKAVAKEMLFLK